MEMGTSMIMIMGMDMDMEKGRVALWRGARASVARRWTRGPLGARVTLRADDAVGHSAGTSRGAVGGRWACRG